MIAAAAIPTATRSRPASKLLPTNWPRPPDSSAANLIAPPPASSADSFTTQAQAPSTTCFVLQPPIYSARVPADFRLLNIAPLGLMVLEPHYFGVRRHRCEIWNRENGRFQRRCAGTGHSRQSKKVKNPTLSHKTRQGWGTLGIVMMFVGLRALKRAVMFGPARPLSFRILAD